MIVVTELGLKFLKLPLITVVASTFGLDPFNGSSKLRWVISNVPSGYIFILRAPLKNSPYTMGFGGYFDKGEVLFGAFSTDETNIAERMKKAFIHLITQCGGKKEAF